ncbi:G-protein coupled receptor family C group 5 member C-like [Paramacrobiotus metropolitanus]|uniref:G-protein coupled receptor family C group 5 member C-like n=1 Tax=Paramacrobiotus metropolitanus TaxID=2943436 RepID=UPI00244636C8|nr:G-protein coupled receptor family C group 5 member C-like [Paramacrobiotus metropolitanus]XP_055327616.1 G-protein coupled receptor family C group 5 member C-like [Paramacrobiotus metropolitanus]XP_055327617.1 G-protein coupled receptor family C group 5 member C-like [Paramacrobiotus metropolitanus]XP_055327618.1 G-protein coupled receptor family C group 5 member C-like [Paramacrobiotus metropolitanus]
MQMGTFDAVGYRVELWLTVLIILASLGIIITFSLWSYTLYKILSLNLRTRNLWLSQASLFFIVLSYAACFIFIPVPSNSICGSIRFLPGFCYGGLFATLLLKTLNIIQENRDVPVSHQLILFWTLVAVQAIIAAEWLILIPPRTVMISVGKPDITACNTSLLDILVSLVWQMVLLFILCIATSVARYRTIIYREEAFLISVCVGSVVAIWICWILLGTVGSRRPHYEDPCLAFGLLTTATTVLILIFLPRARRLSKLSRTLKHSSYIDESSIPSKLYTVSTNPSVLISPFEEKLSRNALHHSTTSLHSLSQFSPNDAFLSMQNKNSNVHRYLGSTEPSRPNSQLVYFSPIASRSVPTPVYISRENVWIDDGTHL